MTAYIVGANDPEVDPPGPDVPQRRWPSMVHAVHPIHDEAPFRALCGRFVLYRSLGQPWPPGVDEDRCPDCLRLTGTT